MSLISWRTMTKVSSAMLLTASLAHAQTNGQNGTTLAAAKTLDICVKSDGQWLYSGEVSVWNSGSIDTKGFEIRDHIQNKNSGPTWTDRYWQTIGSGDIIPAGTTQLTALSYPYSFSAAPLSGTIRNVADVVITNHSGYITDPVTYFGPSPKATYTGPMPPPKCEEPKGCTYTRGYWTSKPGVVWPAPYSRDQIFYYSQQTTQQVLETPAGGSGYYILAAQFIAARLNKATGAYVPSGVNDVLVASDKWFNDPVHVPSFCDAKGSCGDQKAWGKILDDYNNGIYPDGPGHCDETAAR